MTDVLLYYFYSYQDFLILEEEKRFFIRNFKDKKMIGKGNKMIDGRGR